MFVIRHLLFVPVLLYATFLSAQSRTANSDNPDITDPATQWIRRIPFLESEKQNNAAEVEKAIQLLGGPDKVTTPLWWDKN